MEGSVWLLVLLVHVHGGLGARILVFQPSTARSHIMVMEPLYETLAARGHQVTWVTSYPHQPPLPNLREIDISSKHHSVVSNFTYDFIKTVMPDPFRTPIFMSDIDIQLCERILEQPSVRGLIKSNEKYDLVITEIFTADCFVPFTHKFGAPLVSFMTSMALPWAAERVGLPDNPAYIPNYLVPLSSRMTFLERLYSSAVLVFAKLVNYYYCAPTTQRMVDHYFGDSYPPLAAMVHNTSLVFVNSHFSLSGSRPFPPNVVEIGGIHIRNSTSILPKDLQDILDESTEGVILVSFGTIIRTSTMPPHFIQSLMKVFSTIPQRVIFKYEDELTHVPPNVVIRKWLPQQKIIEHKNVKAFFGHGGLGSTIEAVYFGKPLIGLPLFADQARNIASLAQRGAGVMLTIEQLDEQHIRQAVTQVLDNPEYAQNMARLSRQFRDRPQSPLDTAVYWTEYVIRHQGAPQLRPASTLLSAAQYLLLDVTAVLLLPLFPFIYLFYFLFFRAVEVSPNDLRNYMQKKKD